MRSTTLRYEIRCEFPDHTAKKDDATHWVTVDWAFTKEEADEKKKLWQKKGPVKVFDTERPKKKEEKKRRRRKDEDDDWYE